jgi:hypothetical protein
MLSRSYCEKHGVLSDNPISEASLLPLGSWNPFIAAALGANSTFGSEWQSFIVRECQQYLALIQDLSQAQTTDQVVSAYTDYWRQATERCGKELTTLTKLMTGMTSKMAITSQIVPEPQAMAVLTGP